jgi:hypothetical protein
MEGALDDASFDQRVYDEDEEGVPGVVVAQAYLMRPLRSAWREDVMQAPSGRPVYAHELNSVRLIVAQRDDEAWSIITRDGELQPIEGIAQWAPLESALG